MDRKIEKKKFSRKNILISSSGVIFLVFIVQMIFGNHESFLKVDKDKLIIEDVKKGIFQDYVAVVGTVEPIKTVCLDAVEGGSVEVIIAEEGSMVQKGDIILKLSNTDLLLDIMMRESEIAERENNLRTTRLNMEQNRLSIKNLLLDVDFMLKRQERQYNNNKVLFSSNSISREEFEKSKEEYEMLCKRKQLLIESQAQDSAFRMVQVQQLEASLKRMHENLIMLKKKQDGLLVKAPVDGQLAYINPEIGESLNQGSRIGQVNVLESYKIEAEIDEHYIARISKGLTGDCDFSQRNYPAFINKIYPEVKNGRFIVDMNFHSTVPEKIRIGQTTRIKLQLGESDTAVLLPKGGFYQNTGGQWVYVMDASGSVASKRNIKIGRQNPKYFEVIEGLKPGEKVITSAYDVFGNAQVLSLK